MGRPNKYDVVIVGAGLAGLACALRLNKKGKRVLVIEKNEYPGGKLAEWKDLGFRWDLGPSLFTEPKKVDELFELYEKKASDYFEYVQHDESCRYFFSDGSQITLSSNQEQVQKELSEKISKNEARNYQKYTATSNSDYGSLGALFLDNTLPTFRANFQWKYLKNYPSFLSKKFWGSLDSYNKRRFDTEKMQLIFNRFGTYNGSNPYQMSGLYNMISSPELGDGTYFPKKGMRSIIDALYQLCLEEKIEFQLGTTPKISKEGFEYTFVCGNKFSGRSANIVSAIDHVTFYKSVFQDASLSENYSKQERSTSGLVFYWGIDTKIEGLGLHNVVFSDDYEKENENLFESRKNNARPTFYIHISSILNSSDAPLNGQNLFIMINTSAYLKPDSQYLSEMKTYLIDAIQRRFGVDLSKHIVAEHHWDNAKIESLTGSYMGAIYGASSNQMTAALSRHPNKSRKHKGLYFCGGTVHPGGGIPLVLRSSKIVADLIE
jgi:phytoene desaturase